jgi:2-polyprenyl-6-hydroxyphenyl methylase/3-demethylubiquinone-9 3-methyltransferase
MDAKELHGEEYAHYFRSRDPSARLAGILRHVEIPADAKVLDVGCGYGALTEVLNVAEYHGVDFAEPFIRMARELAAAEGRSNCIFHLSEITEFAGRHPGEFDMVFALDLSEHVPDPEWRAIVSSLHGALKPGGRMVVHTPNLDFVVERAKDVGLMRQFDQHIAVRTPAANAAFFDRFSRVTVKTLPHYNVLRWLHPLRRLPLVGKHFAARVLIVAER